MNKKNKTTIHYRQGDVLIERIDSMPINCKPVKRDNGRVILAYGEVTGHAHAITDEHVDLFETAAEAGVTFMEVKEALAALKHDEHDTIALPAGTYRVSIQKEYVARAIQNTRD